MASDTLNAVHRLIIDALKQAEIESYQFEARIILEERSGRTWGDLISHPDAVLEPDVVQEIRNDIDVRLSGKPLSRIYCRNEFWGLPFQVNQHTLDPRSDTETIIDRALSLFDKDREIRILDLGTGSGCIVIALLSEFPKAKALAVDVSENALDCARDNAKLNKVDDRCEFLCGSWFESVEGTFDLIVSNPPYIRSAVIPSLSPEVKNHDPILALDGGQDGLQPYKTIFSHLKTYLNPNGIGLFEIGYDQKDDVMRLSETTGFAQRTVHMDMAGNPRVVEISCGDK
ncbi:MAG: peptide chain release factor N(5)-glutamine methyltransferase [Alphaproteobacteria bacterium]